MLKLPPPKPIKAGETVEMKHAVALIFSSLLIACASADINKVGNGGLIAFSLESGGLGAKGKGGTLTLMNLQTKDTISTKPLSPFSIHSVAPNVPPGTYTVTRIRVPVGSRVYSNWSEDVGQYFGEILVESG